MAREELVLVTGGSGFLGSRCILTALEQGYQVRTTLRSLQRADEVRKMLLRGGATETQAGGVEFVAANLLSDEGWFKACKDCTFVLHVASPFPAKRPKHEDELILPARDGTLRVMRAAAAARTVKRVVVTSSIAAMTYGQPDRGQKAYTERDWTVLDNPTRPVAPYPKSKTLAEQAAWDFIAKNETSMELATVLPGGIFGPVIGGERATTVQLVDRMMKGKVPGLPRLWVGCVDVRDVADLHLRAMIDLRANGERFLCLSSDGLMGMQDVAQGLRAQLGSKAQQVPTRVVPDFVLKLVGLWDGEVSLIVPELGKQKFASSAKAQDVLGWKPRSATESLVATALSLEELEVAGSGVGGHA